MAKVIETLFKGLSLNEIEEILFANMDNSLKPVKLQPVQPIDYKVFKMKKSKYSEKKVYRKF